MSWAIYVLKFFFTHYLGTFRFLSQCLVYTIESFLNTQILKIFDIEPKSKLYDVNSKKHLTKIQDMITNQFYNEKTNNYLKKLFYPDNEDKLYKQRKKSIELINQISNENIPDLKTKDTDYLNIYYLGVIEVFYLKSY